MQRYSYESILGAVGRVLDSIEARSFAVRETAEGLSVELLEPGAAQTQCIQLGLADLAHMLDWAASENAAPRFERVAAGDEGTLAQVLERQARELVSSR